MEVKDFKVSISPREAAEVLEKHMDEDVLGEILDAYELQTEQGEVVMRLFEKYYMRSSNRATLTFLASNLDGVTHVHLAAGGGGQGMISVLTGVQEKILWNWRKMLCVSICWSDGLWKKAGKF